MERLSVVWGLVLCLQGVCAPPKGKRPAPFRGMPPATREMMRKMEAIGPLMEDAVLSLEPAKSFFPAPDGVYRNLLPVRTLKRPATKANLYLWPGPKWVAVLQCGERTNSFLFIDSKMEGKEVPTPQLPLFPCVGVGRERGVFLLGRTFMEPGKRSLFRLDDSGRIRLVFDIKPENLMGKKSGWRGLVLHSVDFFEWGDGYGLLCNFEATSRTKLEKERAWIVRFDARLRRTGVVEVRGGGGLQALGVGPGKKLAAVMQPNAITFVHASGKCDVVPIPHAQPWADKMFGGYRYGACIWTPPGTVPGAKLFAIPYLDRGTLPVIDVTTKPPVLIHTLDIAGLSLNTVVSLVAGERVFAKMISSSRIRAWDFSHGVTLLWTKDIPGIRNKYLTSFGYYKGNVIVLGKAIIYFVDENTGAINYTFCAPSAQKRYDEFSKTGHGPIGYPPYFISYAILGHHLIGSSHNFHDPLYVWEIPEKLIPRKLSTPQKKTGDAIDMPESKNR